ncbi:MAG: ornithine cyclodeaminase family protein [Bacteroidetes bacterium]|nr:ornithine cyclodeaminase family protein [Bacteroidota bacterium]
MLFLKDDELDRFSDPEMLVSSVEAAMVWDETHPGNVPQRMHINRGDNTFLMMPAFGPVRYGTKVVSVLPGNSVNGMPVISGTYQLNDNRDGSVLALMSAAKLTALRTGAIGAVAVKHLSDVDATNVGIVGCGVQARALVKMIAAVRAVKRIYYFSRTRQSAEFFGSEMKKVLPNIEWIASESISSLISSVHVVVTATTSPDPVLPDREPLLMGKTFIGMGSYKTNMREFPDAVFRLAHQVLLDAPGTRYETGDALHPVNSGIRKAEDVFTLGKILTGTRQVSGATKVFKSAGYALFDLFVAEAIWQRALLDKKNMEINF